MSTSARGRLDLHNTHKNKRRSVESTKAGFSIPETTNIIAANQNPAASNARIFHDLQETRFWQIGCNQ
jgi:hypothetical protein